MARVETKSELQQIITDLEHRIDYYGKEGDRHRREVARLSRLFINLHENHDTLQMRFGWLEEAATNVVNACPEHLPQLIVALADDLGIEIDGE